MTTQAARKLTEAMIKRIRPPEVGRDDYPDTVLKNFGLRVTDRGRKTFYTRTRINGKQVRWTGKAPYPAMSLKEAREQAGAFLVQAAAGVDVRVVAAARRREEELEAKRDVSYADTVERFIEQHAIKGKKNTTSPEQRRILLKHGAGFGALRAVRRADLQAELDRLMEEGKGYAANRLHAAWRTFFKWADSRDLLDAPPMAKVEKPFLAEESRTRVYSDAELEAIWRAADKLPPHTGAFIKLLMLTGKRKRALAAMRWDEIEDNVWTPSGGTKTKRRHATPLSSLAARIVGGISKVDSSPFAFPGRRDGTAMDPSAWLQRRVKSHSGIVDFDFHSIRRTVETRMAKIGVSWFIRDMCLDHASKRGTGDDYDLHDYVDEKRAAFEAWARYLESLVTPKGARRLR